MVEFIFIHRLKTQMLINDSNSLTRRLNFDFFEKFLVIAGFALLTYRMIFAYLETSSPVTLIYLIDQLIVIIFILIRRASNQISLRIKDWIIGFAGTFFPLLIAAPNGQPLVPPFVVIILLLFGFIIHISAKLTLRRSFGVIAANRGVKASGIYRFVRHPMYLGYIVSHIGLLLAGPTLTNIVVILIAWTLFIGRIIAEERILLNDDLYREYVQRTRYRLVPGVY